ncbi:uncharacterized protein [Oscarella lobularis]|uniref:uncharacterized protein isoform X2 n=1 Tax=Oscarella lobularis TaxID=121494 RepID=UPI003313E301
MYKESETTDFMESSTKLIHSQQPLSSYGSVTSQNTEEKPDASNNVFEAAAVLGYGLLLSLHLWGLVLCAMSSTWCIVAKKSSSTNCNLDAFPVFTDARTWDVVYLALCIANALLCLLWISSKREFQGLKHTMQRLVTSLGFWSHVFLLSISVGFDVFVIASSPSGSYAEYGYSLWICQKLLYHIVLFLLIYFREPQFRRLVVEKWLYKATLLLFAADHLFVVFTDSLKVVYKLTASPPHGDVRDTIDIYFTSCNLIYRKMAFDIFWQKFFRGDISLFTIVGENLPSPPTDVTVHAKTLA